MTDRTADRLVRELRTLRSTITAGSYESLDKTARHLEKLLAQLPQTGASEAGLERVKAEAARTESVLQAARDGIKEASARIAAIRDGVKTQTYSAGGARSDLSGGQRRDHLRRV